MKDDNENKNKTRGYRTNKTKTYSGIGKTQVYTNRTNSAKQLHGLSIYDEIILNEQVYKILDVVSEDTGEAIIYKVEDSEGCIKALKLYFRFTNWKEEPNQNSLSKISKLSAPNILQLHDFATIGSGKKYKEEYCFEISQYAKGGNFFQITDWKNKYNPEFIWQRIVPQLFEGIKIMHANRIIHTDIKPSNIFYLDKNQTKIVIGDYGSSKTYEDEESDSRITSAVKSTQFYMPSEQGIGQLSNKNDYFAFGMVLLHLLYPEKVGVEDDYSKVERKKEKGIRERLYEGQDPVFFEHSSRYAKLNQLISGLTQDHHSRRWGEQEVGDFLRGRNVAISKKIDQIGSTFLDLGSEGVLRNNDDFITFIKGDAWEEMFVNNIEMRTKILSFLRDTNSQAMSKEIWRIVNVFRQHEHTLGKTVTLSLIQEAIIRYIKPLETVMLGGEEFLFDEKLDENELKVETARYLATLTEQKSVLGRDFPRYIYLFEFLLGTHPKGKGILAFFWKKMGLSSKPPIDFTLFSPSVFAKQKYADKIVPLLDSFIFENNNDKLQWYLTLNSFEGNSIQYQLESSLKEWFEKNKIPIYSKPTSSKYKISHKVIYDTSYQGYRNKNYKIILNKIAKKHSFNPNGLIVLDTNNTMKLISNFLNQNSILWTGYGEKFKEFCLSYDEKKGVKISGKNENVFEYNFQIYSSLFGFLHKNGFPISGKGLGKQEFDFHFTYEENHLWQNFSSLEWLLGEALEDIAEEISKNADTIGEIIVGDEEWDKIERTYAPHHEKWQKKLKFRYALILFAALVVVLLIIFVQPVFLMLGNVLISLLPFLKWVITISLFLALLYALSIIMEKKL
jgi:serine/threonine protein kinase